jgi:predicted AAA+ superfamily ATPase
MKHLQYQRLITHLAFAHQKMAFVTGPRQVGKTTLAKELLEERGDGRYLNWDDVAFRRQWIKDPKTIIPLQMEKKPLIVLDEIHKAARWKSYLKGVYDTRGSGADILVTGSARLDIFRRGGDSLLGRYFLFHLHPFTMGEIQGSSVAPDVLSERLNHPIPSNAPLLQRLLEFGGFPEPFLKKDPTFLNLWRQNRIERLIREDLVDLTRTTELALIESMFALLPERVGSPLSLNSLREDLQVSHPTLKRWVEWACQLYYLWKVSPYSKNITRALHKEPKVYLWEWSEISDPGARFENLVGSHLLKACHFWKESGQGNFELFYLRDKEKREVDFVITHDKKIWLMAECKWGDCSPAKSLLYFSEHLKPQIVLQIVGKSDVQEWFHLKSGGKGILLSADKFLTLLP